MKDIKKSLVDMGMDKAKVNEVMKEVEEQGIENLSQILNKIFGENSSSLKSSGTAIFEFEGQKIFFIDSDKSTFQFFDEKQIDLPTQELLPFLKNLFKFNEASYVEIEDGTINPFEDSELPI